MHEPVRLHHFAHIQNQVRTILHYPRISEANPILTSSLLKRAEIPRGSLILSVIPSVGSWAERLNALLIYPQALLSERPSVVQLRM